MGLGYLIHMFQKEKGMASYSKITALFAVTFVFDAILAYLIEKKIFDVNRTLEDKYGIDYAIVSPEFWSIIFAGFVVYIIWGLVFDFVIKEIENIDKIKIYISSIIQNKQNLVAQRDELLKAIAQVEEEITAIKGRIKELQVKIDGFVFEKKRYLLYHSQYMQGWLQAIGSKIALAHKEKDDLYEKCKEEEKLHLQACNVDSNDSERIVFY
jgi:hypothetical protein